MVLSALMAPGDDDASIGLIWGWNDVNNFMYVRFDPSQFNLLLGTVQDGSQSEQVIGTEIWWYAGQWLEMEVVIRDFAYEVFVDGWSYPDSTFVMTDISMWGQVGFYSHGSGNFSDFNYRSKVTMHLGIDCPNTDDDTAILLDNIAFSIKADPSQLTLQCDDSSKRDGPGVDLFIEGDMDIPAHTYAGDLFDQATSGDADLADSEVSIGSEVGETDTYILAEDEPLFIELLPELADLLLLGAGAAAGIAIGGAAAVGAAAGAAVVVKKKLNKRRRESSSSIPMENTPTQKRGGGGVDVFTFDPSKQTSITGRGAPNREWI